MEHTPGKLEIMAYEGGWTGLGIRNQLLFKLALDNEANAARAALCWNSRDALLEACKEGNKRITFLYNKAYGLDRVEREKTLACIDFITEAIALAEKEG